MTRPQRSPCAARRGLALLDVVVSAAVSAVLFAGMASAVMLSLRAGDVSVGTHQRSRDAASAVLAVTRELQHATAFNSSYGSATRVEFTIPDQTGDGNPETVRYSWSGVAGEPLYRTFNGGTAEETLKNVHVFNLKYHAKTIPPAPVSTESAETLFLDQSGLALLSVSQEVSASGWIGAHLAPALPEDAVSWRITRIQAHLDHTSSVHGIPVIQVRTADPAKKPTGAVVGQAVGTESVLTGNWCMFTFENAGGLSPSDGACVVIASGNGTAEVACSARYQILTSTPSSLLLTTSDGGATWSTSTTNDLWLRVWGRSTTQTAGSGAARTLRTGVDVTVRVGSDTRTTVTSSVETVNQPEVAAP
jgi:hypothetical protein